MEDSASDEEYNPYKECNTPLEAAQIYLGLIKAERASGVDQGQLDYFALELEAAEFAVSTLSDPTLQEDDLWEIVLSKVEIPLVKELGEILEAKSYEELIW